MNGDEREARPSPWMREPGNELVAVRSRADAYFEVGDIDRIADIPDDGSYHCIPAPVDRRSGF